jgi:hypothetical protein
MTRQRHNNTCTHSQTHTISISCAVSVTVTVPSKGQCLVSAGRESTHGVTGRVLVCKHLYVELMKLGFWNARTPSLHSLGSNWCQGQFSDT